MKGALIFFGCLCVLGMAAPPAIEYIQRLHNNRQRLQGNRYPGTAQQAGRIYLWGKAAQVRNSLQSYNRDHSGAWPDSLADLTTEKLVNEESLRYPNIEDLPDRRDILKMRDFVPWIYLKPTDGAPAQPVLIAPLPFRSSMGHTLPKPRRIILTRDGTVSDVDEDQIELILRRIGQSQPTK